MKKHSFEVIRTLEGEVNFLLDRAGELDNNLTEYIACEKEQAGSQTLIISMAYTLSGIYSCFEDQFFKIARVFENRVENLASWHKELLERMRIEVPNIRPAVISRESFAVLDEMRGFRHVFRSSYMFTLDVERLMLVIKRWQKGKERINDVKHFLEILEK